MTSVRRAAEPDPWTASDQAEFRDRLRDLLRWAGYTSLEQLKAGASRRGVYMPVQTANGALNKDRLPTAAFVERIAIACGADVKRWLAARDALADRPYLRQVTGAETAPHKDGVTEADIVPDICPYPGLAAFGVNEAQWFFGREKVIADVLGLLVERLRGTGPLMIAGPSGTGKSSLLRAGLLPALNAGRLAGSRTWVQLVFTPTADPLAQLAIQVSAHLHTDPEMVASELLSNPGYLADVLRNISAAEGNGHDGNRVSAVIIVDQFEDVFTLCSDEQRRQAFISALCAASYHDGVPPALVVLGMRADFLGRCADYPPLAETFRKGQLLLGPMSETELRDAVEKPAQAVGLELKPGLVDVMLGELGAGADAAGALPLLAHALLATWQHRDGRVLTLEGYRLTGGITGAVAKTAERVYQRLDPDRQELARTVLFRMIQFGDGSADTRRQVDRARLVAESTDPAGVEAVLETLTEARLVTAHEATVEIIHEALLREWPRLRRWINDDRPWLLQEQRLVAAAEAWDRDGRHDSDLYRGLRLASVQERVEAASSALPALALEFLQASIECERAEQQSLLRRARKLRQLVAVLSCLVLIAATTTTLAVLSRNELAGKRDENVSRQVAGVAAALRVSDPDLAAQLALAAYRIADTAEARGALMTALVNLDPERRSDSDSGDAVETVAFSNDGQLLVAASRDRFARVWAIGNRPSLTAPPIAYAEHPGQVRSAVLDPTARVLATSGADGLVRIWPVKGLAQSNKPISFPNPSPEGGKGPLAFSPDGSLLATSDTSGRKIRLWNVSNLTDPRMEAEFVAHRDDIVAVAFRRDGQTLATTGRDASVKLWDITNRNSPIEVADLNRHVGFVLAIAFSPNGHLLAIGNPDGTTTLWDVKAPRQPHEMPPLSGHLAEVAGITFSPDSSTLATASYDNTARLWNVSDPAHPVLIATLSGDFDKLYSVAFHPDGRTLATSSQGDTVRLWETDLHHTADEICELASPVITPEQWDFYLPGHKYTPPCSQSAKADRGGTKVRAQPGSTLLVAAHSDKCVAIKGAVPVPVATAYQFTCTRTAGARWNLQKTAIPRPDGGVAYHIRNSSTGMCLDALNSGRRVGQSSVIVQRPCVEESLSQLWKFEARGRRADSIEGRFVNTEHEDCLNVRGGAVTDGAHIVRWPCGNDLNEIFRVSTNALDG